MAVDEREAAAQESGFYGGLMATALTQHSDLAAE